MSGIESQKDSLVSVPEEVREAVERVLDAENSGKLPDPNDVRVVRIYTQDVPNNC